MANGDRVGVSVLGRWVFSMFLFFSTISCALGAALVDQAHVGLLESHEDVLLPAIDALGAACWWLGVLQRAAEVALGAALLLAR
jgi:hypothetical protein